MTKIRLQIAAAVVIVLALSGCGRVDADEMTSIFGGQTGVTDVRTDCTQSLPFAVSCDVVLELDPDVSPAELASLLSYAASHPIESPLSAQLDVGDGYQTLDLGSPDNVSSLTEVDRVAATFLLATRLPGVTWLAYHSSSVPGESSLEVQYPTATDPAVLQNSQLIDSVLPDGEASVASDLLTVLWMHDAFPTAETTLFAAVADRYLTSGGNVQKNNVAVVVQTNVDAAIEFAESLPEFAGITLVDVNDGTGADYSNVDLDDAVAAKKLLDLAKTLDGYKSAKAAGSRLTIYLDSPTQIRPTDDALSALPEYDSFIMHYDSIGASVYWAPNTEIPIDELDSLVATGLFEDVDFTVWKGKLALQVGSDEVHDPADIGFALADAGLDEMPGASITIGAQDTDGKYSTQFYAGKSINPGADTWLDRDQARALSDGWANGAK